MYSREITLRNTPRQPVYLQLCMADFAFRTETSRLYMARRLRKQPLRGYVLRFSPHVSAICKRDVSGQASESPYIDEMRAADKLLRLTPAFNVLFLRRSMYFSSYASTFNRLKHRCESNSPMFAPSTAYAKPIARTQSKPLTSAVWRILGAHSRPHLHWMKNLESRHCLLSTIMATRANR